MVPATTTIDAFSPLIDYQPTDVWLRGGADGDTWTRRYKDGTFMLCGNDTGATATFNFTGTEVHIFGAYRSNSGPYSVVVDGVKSASMRTNGSAPEISDQLFQVELFAAVNLTAGVHQVVLTNEWDDSLPSQYTHVDIDYITFTSSIDSLDSTFVQTDQTDYFSYSPDDVWATVTGDSDLNGGTGHSTPEPGASMSFAFNGDRVALYGTYGEGYAVYSAQLDDGPAYTMNSSRPGVPATFQQLLFQADLLDADAPHNLTLTVLSHDNTRLAIDYAEVDSASNRAATTTAVGSRKTDSASPSNTQSDPTTRLSAGAIGGIIVGCILGAKALATVLFVFWRRRRTRRPHPTTIRSSDHIDPYVPATWSPGLVLSPRKARFTPSPSSSGFFPDTPVTLEVPPNSKRSSGPSLQQPQPPPSYTSITRLATMTRT
ncbi:hypothetical protein BD626DRAFT_496822 [Schizophyllum amplum]|uniref:Transmembrane protein n=1 Tax=Schizophyllum amplum TaxID=97359 RepID=A0A550CDI1_9AGAR|nr:hypothetical protein BD626DRAFT_496822 [Auriculariopsis ampla]